MNTKLQYFEVAFSDSGNPDDCNATWVCICGTDRPTVAEAQQFMAKDSDLFKAPVVGVFPIDEQTARACYDFDREADWPIFSKGGGDDVCS